MLLKTSLLLIPFWAGAQTAEDYFHRGAQFYVWGQKPEAKNEIFTGLKLFPTDPLLNGMAVLLNKEEKQEQQQQQQQQQEQQDQQDQKQNQSQQQQAQQQNQEQQPQPQQQQNQEEKQQAEQPEQQSAQASKEEKDQEEQGETGAAAGQMTPEQARQLLDSQKGQEKMLIQKQQQPLDRSRKFKDW